jgi:histidine triad (HIT) family protein
MYNKDNIFTKIIQKEIPSKVVYEDDEILAFHDAFPVSPIHVLVIPKGEYISFPDFIAKALDNQIAHFFKMVKKIASDIGAEEDGYRIVSNHKEQAGQSVFHFHVHIIGGKKLSSLV